MNDNKLAFFNSDRCPTTIRYIGSNEHHDCGLPANHEPPGLHQCSICGLAWTGLTYAARPA